MLNYMLIRLRAAQSRSERGASAVEYGLLVALIAVAIIVAVGFLGDTLDAVFTEVDNSIKSA